MWTFPYLVAYGFVSLVDGVGFLGLLIFHFRNFKVSKSSVQLYAEDEDDSRSTSTLIDMVDPVQPTQRDVNSFVTASLSALPSSTVNCDNTEYEEY